MRKLAVRTSQIFVPTALFAGAYFFSQTPIQGLHTKGLTLLLGALATIVSVIQWPALRQPVGGVTALVLLFLMSPGREVDTGSLQSRYWRNLFHYRDVPYIWGGETMYGIDCSGLIRRAYLDALWDESLMTANPALGREALFVWLQDCTAQEMKDGYRGRIRQVMSVKSLNQIQGREAKNGDIAVTANGLHVLAYLGKNSWIQADPNKVNGGDKVITTSSPSSSGWFNMKVVICRWRLLDSVE